MARLTKRFTDISWRQMLDQNSQESLVLLCERLQIEEEWKHSMQEPAAFLEQYFLEYPESFYWLLTKEEFDLLLLMWEEHPDLDLEYASQRSIVPLEKLGFLRYDQRQKTVFVNEEAKDNFYFLLKSRLAAKQKEQYQSMEYAVKGILYFYGVVNLSTMYDIIEKEYDITHTGFWRFLIGRMEFWSFLGILKNKYAEEFYVISYEVRDRDEIIAGWMREPLPGYKEISVDEAIQLGMASGIGPWKGTEDLLAYGCHTLYGELLPATVFVKTLLVYIQNGDSLEKVKEKTELKIKDFTEEEKETVQDKVEEMYWHTPIYHLKGHDRSELEAEANRFSVIEGGRQKTDR